MEQTFLVKVGLPVALFTIMLGMGLGLMVADFKRVIKFPKAVAIGLFCQMFFLPAVGFGIVKLIRFDEPALAVGLMVLAFCPGGTTSNLFSHLARGDVALSITLTAIVSLVTPFSIPLLTTLAMNHLMGESQQVVLPLGKTIVVLLVITVVPVGIGMAIKHKFSAFAKKCDRPVKILSVVFLFAIIAAVVKENAADLPRFFRQVGLAALLLNVITMAGGFFVARLARLKRKQQITIGMEVGIQNGTVALMVTGTLLANTTMTIAPAIYSLIMFATGGLFGYLVNINQKSNPDIDAQVESEAQTQK